MRRYDYEIRVAGALGDGWVKWFDGLSVHHEKEELGDRAISILCGSMDQAALCGVLMRICDLGLPLMAVNRVEEEGVSGSDVGGCRGLAGLV